MLLLTNYFYSQITASASLVKPINCISNAEINITVSGGQLPYEYSINKQPHQISNIFKNLAAGYYVIEVKDALKNVKYTYITVEEPQVIAMTSKVTNSTNIADDSGKITVIGTGGTEPYMYTLTNNAGLPISSPQESNSFTGLKSGTYGVQIKDAGGCNYTKTDITIAHDPNDNPFVITFEATEANCLNPTVVLSIYISGAVSTYQYSIDNGQNYSSSNTFDSLEPGSYNIKVRDAQNRVASTIAVIDPVSNPIVTAMANANIVCKGNNTGSITVTTSKGRAPYTYSLNGDDFNRKDTFTNLRAGTYSIRVKDYNNCISSTTITLTEPPEGLSATAFPVNDQSIIVNAKGGTAPYLYYLQNNRGIVIAGPQDHGIFLRLPLGYYSAQVTDASGCGLIQGPINIIPAPALLVTVDVLPVNCTDAGRITVNATGGVEPYQYSINGGSYQINKNFNNLPAGSYNIAVKDALNTVQNSLNIIIENNAFIASVIAFTMIDCHGSNNGSIEAKASGGQKPYSYSIDNTDFQLSNIFNNLSIGRHVVSIKDANGCIGTFTATITQPDPITTTVTVNDRAILITAFGGVEPYQYSLDGISFKDESTFKNLSKGTYTIYVRDSNKCVVSKAGININPINAIYVRATVTPATCANPTGTITAHASEGIEPYQYSIDNGKTYVDTNIFSGLAPKTHTITIRDIENNIASTTATINQIKFPIFTYTVDNISCKDSNNGAITIQSTETEQDSTLYSINGSAFSSKKVFYNLKAGFYTIVAKNTSECIHSETIEIIEPSVALTAIVTIKDQTITINAKGGTGKIMYAISPDLHKFSTNNTFTNLTPGHYSILTEDENGCLTLTYVTIDPKAPIIDGKNEIIATFKPGQTLADIIVDGQNIKWYSTKNSTTGRTSKMSKTAETQLPPTTVLVDGTTYYASQTINGIESKERLAVTAKLNTLSTPDFIFSNFKYHPNPVKNIITIQNTSVIDEATLFSVSGKVVFDKKINSMLSDLDLSNLASGIYILKVKSDGQEKTIKIVKE